MTEFEFEEITPGVLIINSESLGPEDVVYLGKKYFRFMDYLYVQNPNLAALSADEVCNLCRARVIRSDLISPVNAKVRDIFKSLVEGVGLDSVLEIGAGRTPVFAVQDIKPNQYYLADADAEVVAYHTAIGNECYIFSEEMCDFPDSVESLDMVIAVFVLHFPFHENQLSQLNKRLKETGVIVANVYRRDQESREILGQEMTRVGFKVIKVKDENNLCRDHEYWIIGKQMSRLQACASILKELLSKQIL